MLRLAKTTAARAASGIINCSAASNLRALSSSTHSPAGDGLTLKHFIGNSGKHKHKHAPLQQSGDEVPVQVDGSLPEDRFASHMADRKFFIETYGCQMNVSDSEIVSSILMGAGHRHTEDVNEADIVLLNTCAVRDNAEQKIWHRLKYFEHLRKKHKKERNGLPYVGVLGCMAERLKTKLLEHSGVDFIVGPDAYRDIPRLLSVVAADQKAANVQLSLEETYADITPVRLTENNTSAFVSIMRGCNNMCSYCIVPFTRGRERSRPVTSIVDEIKKLRDQGVKEVMVLGQNVNSYHDKSPEALARFPDTTYQAAEGFNNMFKSRNGGGMYFGELLADISDIDPELRIRFTSPHPKDFPDDVLQLIAERHNICNALHLPAQSGSSTMLERMRRGYTREAYLSLVERARSIIPGVGLSSDFIAGFCGETEEEHQDTLSLMRLVKYDQAFMYAYSRREKTHAAYHMQDDVPAEVKSRRLQEVVDTFYQTIEEKNRSYELGQLHLVLVEGNSKKSTADRPSLSGRADNNKRCVFDAVEVPPSIDELLKEKEGQRSGPRVPLQPGDYVVVRINAAKGHTLLAEAVARTTMAEFEERGNRILL